MQQEASNKDREWNLLQNFLAGEPQAARMFFEKYGGIIKYAVGKVGIKTPVMDREDLFQEMIAYILNDKMKVVRDFKGKCKFSTYLYTVCQRYGIKRAGKENDLFRREEYSPSEVEIPAELAEQTEVWDEYQKEALLQAIEQLDEDSLLFIRMMFYDSRSTPEIMIIFGWTSPNSVYSKKNKIIRKLRKIIRKIFVKQGLSLCVNLKKMKSR